MDLEFGTAGLRGNHRRGNKPYEYLYSTQSYTGTGKLYHEKGKRSGKKALRLRMIPVGCPRNFAKEAACCLAANGIKAYIFESAAPDAGVILCGEKTRMYRRHQYYGKP